MTVDWRIAVLMPHINAGTVCNTALMPGTVLYIYCSLYWSKVVVVTLINLREVKKIRRILVKKSASPIRFIQGPAARESSCTVQQQQGQSIHVYCLQKLRGKIRETERSSIRSSNVHIYRIFDKTFVRFKLLCSSERCVSSKKRRWS